MNVIAPVQNTNNIRYANFVRITTSSTSYRFATTPTALTIPAIDALPFSGLGQLVSIGEVQRDIKSTASETTITLVGIDTANLALVLGADLKGSQIEMWNGFFDENNELLTANNIGWQSNADQLVEWSNSSNNIVNWSGAGSASGLYQFFNGYINSFAISEQWMEEARMYVGTISVSASSIQLILQNRVAGRYTNNNSWQFYNAGDTSMNRVSVVSNINYLFGKGASANS
jgi:hypothetical protein